MVCETYLQCVRKRNSCQTVYAARQYNNQQTPGKYKGVLSGNIIFRYSVKVLPDTK